MSFLNGKKHTRYAAAWTLVNAHELAVISGKSHLPHYHARPFAAVRLTVAPLVYL